MCIWNIHDYTVILFVPYAFAKRTTQSFYSLMPIIYCLAIEYSNGIEYEFAIRIFLMYNIFDFFVSDVYFNTHALILKVACKYFLKILNKNIKSISL